MNFYGYKRPDGRVGVRNKVLILPASVCASDTTRIIAQQVVGSVTFNNQLGCSQVASDQQYTMALVLVSGVSSTCWKVTATTTLAQMLMYGREAQSKTRIALSLIHIFSVTSLSPIRRFAVLMVREEIPRSLTAFSIGFTMFSSMKLQIYSST